MRSDRLRAANERAAVAIIVGRTDRGRTNLALELAQRMEALE